ncbi:MAG: hypothetical protein R3C16_01845 [Hyphomonadaceae bacterium]
MSALIVRFTRLSPTHHRFEAIRADGERETRELETRSLLLHDLVHFALESEAGLRDGFYGRLARGADYNAPAEGDAAWDIEGIVAPLQSALKGEVDAAAFVARIRTLRESVGGEAPSWLNEALITRTLARVRQLQGQWRATPFGETMELRFAV